MIFRWSSWYMFGYCLDKAAYRLFKLNRLWKLQLLNEPFSPRELQAEVSFDDYFSPM
ncbi:MAG: WYL domain-containing protein [Christensenellaceae bacterium]